MVRFNIDSTALMVPMKAGRGSSLQCLPTFPLHSTCISSARALLSPLGGDSPICKTCTVAVIHAVCSRSALYYLFVLWSPVILTKTVDSWSITLTVLLASLCKSEYIKPEAKGFKCSREVLLADQREDRVTQASLFNFMRYLIRVKPPVSHLFYCGS